MEKYANKDLTGSLFKSENPKIDYTGSCTINGQEYWLNGWVKAPEGKKRYISLSFKLKEARAHGEDL